MVYENHIRCHFGVPTGTVTALQRFYMASFTSEYDVRDSDLTSFVVDHGVEVISDANRLNVYANVAHANLEAYPAIPMELDQRYYLYVASSQGVLSSFQGNIARQPAPEVTDLTVSWNGTTIDVRGNITNTVPFDYYVLVTQNEQSESNIAALSSTMTPSTVSGTFEVLEIHEPFDVRDRFPFFQLVRDYYAYVYAVNSQSVVSVTLANLDSTTPYVADWEISNVTCVNMGNLEDPDGISLQITFDTTESVEYYATVFPNVGYGAEGPVFAEYTNRDIYTNGFTVTGNVVPFHCNVDYQGNRLQIDTDVRVAILAVDETTRQFSGTATELDLNISLPVVESFGVVPIPSNI